MGATMGKNGGNLLDSLPSTQGTLHIVMLGLDSAGKTTALYRLKFDQYLNTVPTIGFNCEKIRGTIGKAKGVQFLVWDVGGQEKLRPLWRSYTRCTDGIVFVVDSVDVERMEEAKMELMRTAKCPENQGVPVLILANKQDLPGAREPKELEKLLGLHELSPLYPPLSSQSLCLSSSSSSSAGTTTTTTTTTAAATTTATTAATTAATQYNNSTQQQQQQQQKNNIIAVINPNNSCKSQSQCTTPISSHPPPPTSSSPTLSQTITTTTTTTGIPKSGSISLKTDLMISTENSPTTQQVLNNSHHNNYQQQQQQQHSSNQFKGWYIQPACAITGDGLQEGLEALYDMIVKKRKISKMNKKKR